MILNRLHRLHGKQRISTIAKDYNVCLSSLVNLVPKKAPPNLSTTHLSKSPISPYESHQTRARIPFPPPNIKPRHTPDPTCTSITFFLADFQTPDTPPKKILIRIHSHIHHPATKKLHLGINRFPPPPEPHPAIVWGVRAGLLPSRVRSLTLVRAVMPVPRVER